METEKIQNICRQVCKQFPEMRGVQPSIRAQGNDHNLLIFTQEVLLAGGKTMQRTVRVVVADNGKVEKITTSR